MSGLCPGQEWQEISQWSTQEQSQEEEGEVQEEKELKHWEGVSDDPAPQASQV